MPRNSKNPPVFFAISPEFSTIFAIFFRATCKIPTKKVLFSPTQTRFFRRPSQGCRCNRPGQRHPCEGPPPPTIQFCHHQGGCCEYQVSNFNFLLPTLPYSFNILPTTFYFLLHLPPSTSYLLPSSLSKYQQTRGEVWRGEAFFIKDSTKGSKWQVWDFYVFPIPPYWANLGYIFPLFALNTGWNAEKNQPDR